MTDPSQLTDLERKLFVIVQNIDKHSYLTDEEEHKFLKQLTLVSLEFAREAYKSGQKKYMTGLPSFVTEHDYNEWLESKK